ncbi:outer membrane beta-barrel protein [Teredinibacter haidensis]|uniref:outer membrane beta-barrel protein n=1 Tax=Teredinibacter haidensis TaxID=2731755 RepID=UPI000948B5D5|nr:outer membrane beta-barrel protein [Teredinibacter haidensis]
MNKVLFFLCLSIVSKTAFAEGKWSAEFLLGNGSFDLSSGISGTFDDEIFSEKIEVPNIDNTAIYGLRGTYTFNSYIGIEFGYRDFGESESEYIDDFDDTINDKIKTDAILFGVKGAYPISSDFSVNGRIGLANWGIDSKSTDSSTPGETYRSNEDGQDIYYAVGGEYSFNEKMYVGLEYAIYPLEWTNSEKGELENIQYEYTIKQKLEIQTVSLSIGIKF